MAGVLERLPEPEPDDGDQSATISEPTGVVIDDPEETPPPEETAPDDDDDDDQSVRDTNDPPTGPDRPQPPAPDRPPGQTP